MNGMEWLLFFGDIVVFYLAVTLVVKVTKGACVSIAIRVFGWRPMIYNKEIAQEQAKHCAKEYWKRHSYSLRDDRNPPTEIQEQRWLDHIELYSVWLIENYTMAFTMEKKKKAEPVN